MTKTFAWFFIIITALIILNSCGGEEKAEPTVYYKKDMHIEINGKRYVGMAVVPKKEHYTFTVYAKHNIDVLFITSCHRDIVHRYIPKKKYSFGYSPISEIETKNMCALKIQAHERGFGKHSWGFIDFESDARTLNGIVKCNGTVLGRKGVSVCQSKSGLLQQIEFTVPVKVDSKCNYQINDAKKKVWFDIESGDCTYIFMDKDFNIHRLTTYGYDRVLLRK